MPLSMAESGRPRVIQRISGKDGVKRHLAELGFVEGERVTVLNDNGGDMILMIKDTRVALDRTMTNRIFVA